MFGGAVSGGAGDGWGAEGEAEGEAVKSESERALREGAW